MIRVIARDTEKSVRRMTAAALRTTPSPRATPAPPLEHPLPEPA